MQLLWRRMRGLQIFSLTLIFLHSRPVFAWRKLMRWCIHNTRLFFEAWHRVNFVYWICSTVREKRLTCSIHFSILLKRHLFWHQHMLPYVSSLEQRPVSTHHRPLSFRFNEKWSQTNSIVSHRISADTKRQWIHGRSISAHNAWQKDIQLIKPMNTIISEIYECFFKHVIVIESVRTHSSTVWV